MPGQGAVSSTPATLSRHHPSDQSFATERSDDPSWTTSMESPLVRLDRELQSFSKEDNGSGYEEEPTAHQPGVDKGKSREQPGPLLQNVLRQNHNATIDDTVSSILPISGVSPLKFRAKSGTPASSSAIDSLFASPQRPKYERTRKTPTRNTPRLPSTTPIRDLDDSFDDSLDFMTGMSPPVTMQFAQVPRSSIGLGLLPRLGQTPKGQAADRIKRDLLGYLDSHSKSGASSVAWGGYNKESGRTAAESSMSTVPTPPSLSRYTRHAYPGTDSESIGMESSLESMMRRVGLNVPGSATGSTGSSSSSHSVFAFEPSAAPVTADPGSKTPDQHLFEDLFPDIQGQDASMENILPDAQQDSDSDSDSFVEEVHNAAHPSAAFLMASQRQQGADDSFGSSNRSSDSLDDLDQEQGGMVHPFAGMSSSEGDAFDDDSFDDDHQEAHGGLEEETVFGVPPAQRQAAAAPRVQGLRMLGEDLLQDTIGIGAAMTLAGRVEESPTPYTGPR